MNVSMDDAVRVVQNASVERDAYLRQLQIWLGVGSAGGAIAMISLTANLPDPAYVFHFLQPSLWSFLIGVAAAGVSVFFLALRAGAIGSHYAAAHNRDQLNEAVKSIPEVIASPKRLADEANVERNKLIERLNAENALAEQEWQLNRRYAAAWGGSLAVSALAFLFGFAWPLVQVSFFGATLLP